MKKLLIVGCMLLAACASTPEADLAIRNVTVVDVADGSLRPGQTVLVKGNRIVAVASADATRVPDAVDVIDGSGGFLIPGLWDTHVHSATNVDWHFPLFIAHGITSVRNMHSTVDEPLDLVISIKRQLAEGVLTGPRLLANGGVVDGDPPVWPGSVVVRDADGARAAVDELASGGADFIKVYDNLVPEAYLAVMKQAGQRGMPVDGHLPWLVRLEDAAAAGQRTFEHTTGISMGCSSHADAVRAGYVRYLEAKPGLDYPDAMAAYVALLRQVVDTRDPERCRQAARTMLEHRVIAVPTIVAISGSIAKAFMDDPEGMALLPETVRAEWQAMAAGPDPFASLAEASHTITANVRLLNETGVTILAGTDVGNPFLVPGLSLHRELMRLNGAGLSPLQALQAATLLPARVFGLADTLGTVESGKLADLVLLDANPLGDIGNTQRIRAVIANGRLFRRSDLDRLLPSTAMREFEDTKNLKDRLYAERDDCPRLMDLFSEDVVFWEKGRRMSYEVLAEYCPKLPKDARQPAESSSSRAMLGPGTAYEILTEKLVDPDDGATYMRTTTEIWQQFDGKWKITHMNIGLHQVN